MRNFAALGLCVKITTRKVAEPQNIKCILFSSDILYRCHSEPFCYSKINRTFAVWKRTDRKK